MNLDERQQRYLFDSFGNCLVGRLIKGIVHNINGPIQIISMQLELMKFELSRSQPMESGFTGIDSMDQEQMDPISKRFDSILSRLPQMEEALGRIEDMVRVVGGRSDLGVEGPRPVLLEHLIREELEFWKGDLFFKHQVEVRSNFPEKPVMLMAVEKELRDVIDGMLGACIEHLKGAQEKVITISIENPSDGPVTLSMSHTGADFGQEPEPLTNETEPDAPFPDQAFSSLAFLLIKEKSKALGWRIETGEKHIRCLIKKESSCPCP